MTRYAEGTSVPMDRTRAEIEKTLIRYGAQGFAYAWDRREEPNPKAKNYGQPKTLVREYVGISFKLKERAIRLSVPMPHETEVGSATKVDAAVRQRWRALLLVIKAKLEAVASGIGTLESEFLSSVVTDDGRTIGEIILPRISDAVASGRLLPAHGEATP